MNDRPMPEPTHPLIPRGSPSAPFIRFFSRFNIRGKIISIVLVSTLAALGLASILSTAIDLVAFHQRTARQLTVLAEITAMNASAAVVFDDPEVARKTLQALSNDPRILSITLYLSDGRIFARHQPRHITQSKLPDPPRPVSMNRDYLEVIVPVHADGEDLGWLAVRRDYQEYRTRILLLLASILFSSLAGFGLAFLVSTHLQGLIANPILDLAITAHRVSETKDYSLRVFVESKDETGILAHHFNGMMDLIEQHNQELRRAHDELEEKVLERTKDLKREVAERAHIEAKIKDLLWRIQEDNEKLHRSDQLKTDFIANVSHELRTPLTSILGFMKLLERQQAGPLTETQADFVRTTLANAERLLSLVNDLLDMSKLEAGSIQIQYKTQDAKKLIEEVVKSLHGMANNRKVRITVKAPEEPLIFQADGEKLQRVLINLISNAIKFTPAGGVIEISAKAIQRENVEGVLFHVRDSGIGIPKEDLTRIFDKFFQVENHLTRKTGGTGLGLPIARNILTAHRGEIWVESEIELGTTFYFFIPAEPPQTELYVEK